MEIKVKVIAGSKNEEIKKIDSNNFIIKVKERPIKGRANKAIIKSLSKYFDLTLSEVDIISGINSKNKIIKIHEKNN